MCHSGIAISYDITINRSLEHNSLPQIYRYLRPGKCQMDDSV